MVVEGSIAIHNSHSSFLEKLGVVIAHSQGRPKDYMTIIFPQQARVHYLRKSSVRIEGCIHLKEYKIFWYGSNEVYDMFISVLGRSECRNVRWHIW